MANDPGDVSVYVDEPHNMLIMVFDSLMSASMAVANMEMANISAIAIKAAVNGGCRNGLLVEIWCPDHLIQSRHITFPSHPPTDSLLDIVRALNPPSREHYKDENVTPRRAQFYIDNPEFAPDGIDPNPDYLRRHLR